MTASSTALSLAASSGSPARVSPGPAPVMHVHVTAGHQPRRPDIYIAGLATPIGQVMPLGPWLQ